MEEKYASPLREATVQNTFENVWGLRQGKWLYINAPSGEHTKMPDSFKQLRNYKDFDTAGLLFDMENDPEQRTNLFAQHPNKIKEMDQLLQNYREQGYSIKRTKVQAK
jgi:hypothetical protein